MLCEIDFNKSRVVRFAASHWIAFPRSCAGTVRLTLSRSPSSTRAFTKAGARSKHLRRMPNNNCERTLHLLERCIRSGTAVRGVVSGTVLGGWGVSKVRSSKIQPHRSPTVRQSAKLHTTLSCYSRGWCVGRWIGHGDKAESAAEWSCPGFVET